MRYLLIFLFVPFAFSLSSILLSPIPNGYILEVKNEELRMEEVKVGDETYTIVSLPGEEGTTSEVGKPQLPKIARALGIPDNGEVSIEILDFQKKVYDNILLYPFQPPTTDEREREEFIIDRNFYETAEVYPKEKTSIARKAWWREVYLVNFDIIPFAYNPKEKRLIFYNYLKVKISYTGSFREKRIEPWLAGIYKRFLLNYEFYPFRVEYNLSPGVRYLVIAHSDFASYLDSLVNWHQKRGIETRVISKSSFTAQEIKDSILAEYNRSSPPVLRWVLLVGDVDRMPPSYAYGSFPSDYWYSDLIGNDLYGEVGIGRISVANVTELQNFIRKTLKYERNPLLGEWLTKSSLVAHRENYPGKYSACKRGIYNHTYPYYRFTMDTIMGQYLGNAAVAAAINEGRNVVNYRGHGDYQEWWDWGTTGSWTNTDINNLNNGDKTPIVFNVACECHDIAYSAVCLGEAWIRKYPGGAVASLGASDPSYTIPNHGFDSMLYRCLGDTISIPTPARTYKAPMWDLGWLLLFGDAHFVLRHGGSGGPENAQMYLWLADPALQVWTGVPETPTVQYPGSVPLGPYTMRITVRKSGNPCQDALVCLWKRNEFYTYGYTNENGYVDLNINAQTPGEFSVTVTGHEILPFEGTCIARTGNTPYVIYLKHIIDDAPPGGNGDGIVNPGESINLPLWVKNYGSVIGNNVRGKLRTNDPLINITDSLKNFGNIPANDSAFTGSNGYKFTVSPSCTNRYSLRFNLETRDANDSVWNSEFAITVGTPVFFYSGLRVIDSIGNNNRRLDPNERAYLVVRIKNEGLGHGYNVQGKLYSLDSRLLVEDSFGYYGFIPRDSIIGNEGDRFLVHALNVPPEFPIPCSLVLFAEGGYLKGIRFNIVVGELRNTDPTPDDTASPWYSAFEDVDSAYPPRPTYSWIELRNRGTQLPITSDDQTIRIPLPFVFKYYGMRYTDSLSVCSNGWVSPIRTTSTVYTNYPLPDPTSTNPSAMICPNWDDLYPPYGNRIWYLYQPDSHRFIIEWDSVHYFSPNTLWDKFEIIIYDTTIPTPTGENIILFQYYSANNYSSNTVGIEDHTNTRGICLLCNGTYHRTATPIVPGRAIKFSTEPWVSIAEKPLPDLTKKSFASYPNPFRNENKISFSLKKEGRCEILIYDAAGKLIRELLNTNLKPGTYTFVWDGQDNRQKKVSKGIYFYKVKTPEKTLTLKTILTE
ncbi:MAG: C25 family cysteine peptidase [candidate division WOR-3 bacterium]